MAASFSLALRSSLGLGPMPEVMKPVLIKSHKVDENPKELRRNFFIFYER
jgi:hypothetical protein